MKKINGILVKVDRDNPLKQTSIIPYTLETEEIEGYYKALDCHTFDIQERKIGNNYYSIYCDDEGLFVENNIPSVVTVDNDNKVIEIIVGNVFICKADEEGETIGLTIEEQQEILANIGTLYQNDSLRRVICAKL